MTKNILIVVNVISLLLPVKISSDILAGESSPRFAENLIAQPK